MHKARGAEAALREGKLLPLYYHDDAGVSMEILCALYRGGARIAEYTDRGVAAHQNFIQLRECVDAEMPGMHLGIGTVKTAETATRYADAGADFIVSPNLNLEVGAVAQAHGLLWIPGCLTPTEIAQAEAEGATWVKIFPASAMGPQYLRAVREVFPTLHFAVTGGIVPEQDKMKPWLAAGAAALGMGGSLVQRQLVDRSDFAQLEKDTAAVILQLENQSL